MKYIVLLIVLGYNFALKAQTVTSPNNGSKSHETLKIDKIERSNESTIIYLSIQNKVNGGYFCADKNISLKNSLGKETYQIIKSENIPVCPDTHQFKMIDEVLNFKLYFPAIKSTIKYLDLTENCNDACFNFKGIILDQTFNEKIDEAYTLYAKGDMEKLLASFKDALALQPDYPYGILYFNIIKILSESNRWEEVKTWYSKFNQSNIIDKSFYIEVIKTKKYYKN